MAVVALIPTGKMEHRALAPALKQIFPEHTFEVRPTENHLDGFTSNNVARLSEGKQLEVPTALDDLVTELLNAIFPARRSQRIDFAYVLEDLEVCNQHQPDVVLNTFKTAVERYVEQHWPQSKDKREQIQQRCSFHLFCPMTEAYFFGDNEALKRVNTTRTPQLPDDVELEAFRTIDSEYLALPPKATFPEWLRKVVKDAPDRERHPKAYLQFLCDPSMSNRCLRYQETKQGAAALRCLNWESVVTHPSKCPFVTAFLDDLSLALQCDLPFLDSAHADDRVRVNSSKRVLRNL